MSTGQKATAVGAAGLSNIPVIGHFKSPYFSVSSLTFFLNTGLFVGPLAHTLIRHMKGSKRKPVGILVDVWNHVSISPSLKLIDTPKAISHSISSNHERWRSYLRVVQPG